MFTDIDSLRKYNVLIIDFSGTQLERIAVHEASTHVRKAKKILKNIVKDVQFSVDMPENPLLGKDIKFFVSVKNTSDKVRI